MGQTKTIMNKNIWIRFYFILFHSLIISSLAYGEINEVYEIDSLYKIINSKKGTDKISTQLDIALKILVKHNEEALRMTNSAKLAAKASGNRNLEMRSYYTLGKIYTESSKNEISLAYLDTALAISEAIKDNWNKGEILYQVGVNKHRMGEALQALESFNASIQACRWSDNFKTAGSAYSVMGTIFRMNGMYDRAIEYNIKSKLNYEKADFIELGKAVISKFISPL